MAGDPTNKRGTAEPEPTTPEPTAPGPPERKREPFEFASVKFRLDADLRPSEAPDAYAQNIRGRIIVYGLSDEEREDYEAGIDDDPEMLTEHEAGRIDLALLFVNQARRDGMSLYVVCDENSEELYVAYNTFWDESGQWRGSFGAGVEIEEPDGNILFILGIRLRADYRDPDLMAQLIRAASQTFCEDGATVAIPENINVPIEDGEWRKFGFVRIEGSSFVVCDNAEG